MSTKCHAHERCETLRKSSISARGYAEIHIQRPFFDNKNSIWNILGLKIQTVETCSSASSIHRNFYFWKKKKSRFLVEFQSFIFWQFWADFGSFEQFWAVLGSFGQKLLHWQWLRACPKIGWNLWNPITLKPWIQMLHGTSHWKATIHTYSFQEVSKASKTLGTYGSLPKIQKAILDASCL